MSTKTSIEWTHVTDNIIVVKGGGWFCIKCSLACNDCYAEAMNLNKWFGGNLTPYTAGAHPNGPPELILRRDLMAGWAKQTKPKLHFVASMTDIFGEWVPREWVFEFLDAMRAAPKQTFQLLTKRAKKMAEDFNAWLDARGLAQGPDNIWLGITAENQNCLEERLVHLISARARIRFLSCEPLLSALDIITPLGKIYPPGWHEQMKSYIAGTHPEPEIGIDWIIAGGKSGAGKDEPTNPDWFRSLRDQCEQLTIAFFFKQWGNWRPATDEELLPGSKPEAQLWDFSTPHPTQVRLSLLESLPTLPSTTSPFNGKPLCLPLAWLSKAGKKEAGRLLDGEEHNMMPTTEF